MTDQASLFEPAPEVELEEKPAMPTPSSTADPDGFGFDYWRALWAAARKGHAK